ncbi:hypothetical protein ABT158_43380 [Nonomuraea sp. NPDC001636]|uniref:hypothetical protein n=1 Tax=Nonomuraea sp. NPDC001636 TaxID=3154391 RepID=UPI00331D63E2
MIRYVSLDTRASDRAAALGGPLQRATSGSWEAVLLRPQTSLFGHDTHPDLMTKAAVLLHSIVTNQTSAQAG